MAYTTESIHTGDGSTTDFSFTFPYIKEADVKVTIEDDDEQAVATTAFSFANPTTLTFDSAPDDGHRIRIFRDTDIDKAYAEHFPGSSIRADDLNNNNTQTIYSDQERQEYTVGKDGGTFRGDVAFHNNVDLGSDTSKTITANGRFDSDIVPSTDSARDLGSSALRWAEVWTDQVTADNIRIAVTGDNEIDTASGNLTLDSAGGTVTVDDNLSVSGTSTLTGAVTASGNITTNANLSVTGTSTLNGDVTANGDIDLDGDIDVDGTANLDNVDIDGTLHVQQASTFVGAITASGGIVGDIEGDITGNADTATALETARDIGGVSFDGTADINLPGVNTAGNQNTSGNAATATALETARTIGGVSFDGTANINLPGVNTEGNQDTTGTAANATHVTVVDNEETDENNLIPFIEDASATGNVGLESDGDFHYNPSSGTVTASTFSGALSGNATTASTLQNARNIAGVSFNGSENIAISLNNLSDVNIGTPGENQDDQVLTWNWDSNSSTGSFGLAAGGSGGSGGISDVESDSSPSLGGHLDVKDKKIFTDTGTNTNIVIEPKGTGAVNVSSSKIINVTDPTNDQDAATKKYVDDEIDGISTTSILKNDTNVTVSDTGDNGKISFSVDGDEYLAIEDDGFAYKNALETPEEVFGLDIEVGGDPKLKVSTSGSSETGEFQVFFGDPNAGQNARGVRLWAGDTSNKHGRVTIEGRVDSTETVFDVNTSANDSTSLSNKISFEASGKAFFQELDINGTATFDGNVTIEDGASLILQNNAETTHTISINADDVTDSYNLTLPPAHGTANQVLRINTVDENDNVELEWASVDTASRLVNSNTFNAFTITANTNVAMVGPLTLNSNQTQTVPTNSTFKIL